MSKLPKGFNALYSGHKSSDSFEEKYWEYYGADIEKELELLMKQKKFKKQKK